VAQTDLSSDSTKLFAANGSQVDVVGSVTVDLLIGSQLLPTNFLVSSKINEVVLGIDFMCNNNCVWQFADKQICIAGEMVPVVYLGRIFVPDISQYTANSLPKRPSEINERRRQFICKKPHNNKVVNESADCDDVMLQVVTTPAVGRQRQLGVGNIRCPAEATASDVTISDCYQTAKQTAVNFDRLKTVYHNSVFSCRAQMLTCPACGHKATSCRAMERHCLGVHEEEWRGPAQPLGVIPPEKLPAARERLRRLRLNSRQRRRLRDRRHTASQPGAGTVSSGMSLPLGVGSPASADVCRGVVGELDADRRRRWSMRLCWPPVPAPIGWPGQRALRQVCSGRRRRHVTERLQHYSDRRVRHASGRRIADGRLVIPWMRVAWVVNPAGNIADPDAF